MNTPILQMKHIRKCFPGVVANDDVNLDVYPGEIHALLGENGAGKSTLMNVLTGIYKPDSGQIIYKGVERELKRPKDAVDLGFGMVHQHFRLVETLTVSENIYLGSSECKNILKLDEMHKRVAQCSREYGLDIDPEAKIWQLSIGELQRVEIIKLLFRGMELFILDEPTAVLTPQETRNLFGVLERLKQNGKAIVFITHKMYEVMTYADRITVLRNGKTVDSVLRGDADSQMLTRMMVGGELEKGEKVFSGTWRTSDVVLELKNVSALNDKLLPALDGVDMNIHEGEILGIAGVAGNGQHELAEVITGLRKPTGGEILLGGKPIAHRSVKSILNEGVAYIPDDRLGMGLVPGMSIIENTMLRKYDAPENSKRGFIRYAAVEQRAAALAEQYDVRNAGIRKPLGLMSGGNQQKLLFAREVSGTPKLIVASYPVRGLDISATDAVHRLLEEQRSRGAAILLISEDLEELFMMSDRIAVLYKGKVTGVVENADATYLGVGSLMAGVTDGAKPEAGAKEGAAE